MATVVRTATLYGLQGSMVDVEIDFSKGLPGFDMVGLASTMVKESWLRVRSALGASGVEIPSRKITVNLSPAHIRKEGTHFDLPVAVGIAASEGMKVEKKLLDETAFFGELSLTGDLRPIRGGLPLAICAEENGLKRIVVPYENFSEITFVKGVEVIPCSCLKEVMELPDAGFVKPEPKQRSVQISRVDACGKDAEKIEVSLNKTNDEKSACASMTGDCASTMDYKDVLGHGEVKRALTICAAGAHGVLMIGSPGCGKTMLASRLPSILPPMSYEEKLEVSKIYSVAGLLTDEKPIINERPFRHPHHSITTAALLGGGRNPRPGELSLAHGGVLFLDELCEFSPSLLDALRQPLEEDSVVIARNGGAAAFPCSVVTVAATNPCKCGYFGDKAHECTCSMNDVARYQRKLSGPFMDRIDIHVHVERIGRDEKHETASSEEMKEKVLIARKRQEERFKGMNISFNSRMPAAETIRLADVKSSAIDMLDSAAEKLGLSMRSYHKMVKIARSIADIEDRSYVEEQEIAEALRYRPQDILL